MINSKTLKTLEYDKILEMMAPYASSETGKAAILNLTPSTNYEIAVREIYLTIEADKVLYEHSVSLSFSFDDVSDCINRARKQSTLSMGEVLKIGRLLKIARIVTNGISDINDESLIMLKDMVKELFISFTLEKDIFRCIQSDTEMSDTASNELKNIRQSINRCNDKIREKLNSYITSSATVKFLQDNIITMRNERYVIPVKTEHRGHISGLIHDQSASGNTVYVEPMMVVELNNELKMLLANEEKEIYRILREFTTRISVDAESLGYNQNILTIMDVVFAKAYFAKETKSKRPEINSHGLIDIRKGRHPLIDLDIVVPVSIKLGNKYRILMITGPNTGGKTVTLKLTGLLTLMGLSGMFIPAEEGSIISVFDNMWCDIGDEQSIEQSLSTFSSHMTNLINITNNITPKSLILLDELGAGTDPQEGAALAMAITTHIIQSNAYGVITTHYPELKEYSLVTDCIENASMDFDPETFKPTYSLVIGIPGASNAIQIASRLGLDSNIIERAKSLLSEDKIKLENVLVQAEEARRKADSARLELVDKQKFIDNEILRLEKDKAALVLEKEKIQNNATKETKRLINIALEEVNDIVDELKDMLEDTDKIDIFRAHKLRKKLEGICIESEYNDEDTSNIEGIEGTPIQGDRVYIKSLKSYGIVDSISKNGKYLIKMGAISISINSNDVMKVKPLDIAKPKVSVVRPYNLSAAKSEINLIGQNTEEALYNLDMFLNTASTGGLNELRIVHGKGAGILRKAINDYLKTSPIIKEHRAGIFGEGETGVTIVKLK